MEPKLSSIAENDLEPLVLLPLPSKHGDGGYVLSYLVGGGQFSLNLNKLNRVVSISL